MAVNITEEQAQEMRDDPNYKDRTQSCPLCDPSVHVEPGISVLHVCQCGNVWQPMQVLSAHPTCIIPNGAVSPDKLLEAFGQKETTPESEQWAALADKWEREQAEYPRDEGGAFAAAAVRCCVKELRTTLSTTKGDEPNSSVWVGWACKLLRQYGLQEEDYDSYSDSQLRDAISEMIQHYVT